MSRKMPAQKPGSSKQNVGTPPEFLQAVKHRLGITAFVWDLAAEAINACAVRYYTKDEDALKQPWPTGGWCWLNPEYSDIDPWVERCWVESNEGAHIAVLIPGSIGANWWRDWVVGKCQVIPLNGRITFVGETDPYPKDCALLLYGPDVEPGYLEPWTWMNSLTEEERLMAKKRTAKPEKKKQAKAKAPAKTKLKIAARGKGRAIKEPKPARAQTVQPSAVADPSITQTDSRNPIVLPSPEDSQRVLKELAELNDRAVAAKRRYDDLKDAAKQAKEKWDELSEQIQTRLRQATHKSDLPLFANVEQREQDLTAMQAGGEIPGTEEPGDALPGESEPDQGEVTPEPGEAPAAAGDLDAAMGGDPPPPVEPLSTTSEAEFL